METSIQSFIEICQWDTARFFIFSNNVFDPLIFYSHLFALIPSFLIGLIIFLKDKKALLNRILFFITTTFSLWAFADLVLWANEKPDFQMFFWSLLVIIEPIIYAACVYFIYVFINKKDTSLIQKMSIAVFLLPTLFFASTKLALVEFDLSNCYREVTEGPLTLYGYGIEILYVLWILIFAFEKYFKANKEDRRQIFNITLGIVLFLLSLAYGNIIGSLTDNWTIAQFGLFGMPIFVGFLAYLIVKYKAFNVKLIATQALVWGLVLLIGSQFLFVKVFINIVLTGITFIASIIFGFFLIKSVKKEIEQKEQLAKLNLDLEDLIKQRENLVHLVTHKVKGSFTRSKYIFAGLLDGTFGEISPEVKKYAEQGLDSDNMGIETVDLVLNAANMEKGLIKYDMKILNFRDLVEQSISDKKVSIERKGLQLESEIKEGGYNLLGDSIWLKEVVNNLIENSIKYTPAGKISVNLEDGDGKIRLIIKDTGVGITEEDKKNLFTEGGRGKDSVKVNVDSTGYGLYTVKLIVETHGGKVWVESEGADKGSTFFVEFKAV